MVCYFKKSYERCKVVCTKVDVGQILSLIFGKVFLLTFPYQLPIRLVKHYAGQIQVSDEMFRCKLHRKSDAIIQMWSHSHPVKVRWFSIDDAVSIVTLSTSFLMFHLISFSSQSISFISSTTVHLIHFIDHSPSYSRLLYLVALILHRHSTLLSLSLFSQTCLWRLMIQECLQIKC